jgi:Tfp pilus assembly protein FimT
MTARRGSTMLEMLIVLMLLALIGSVAVMAIRVIERPSPDDPYQIVADSLRAALNAGRATSVSVLIDGKPVLVAIHPDGSVAADSALRFDRFSGVRADAR